MLIFLFAHREDLVILVEEFIGPLGVTRPLAILLSVCLESAIFCHWAQLGATRQNRPIKVLPPPLCPGDIFQGTLFGPDFQLVRTGKK